MRATHLLSIQRSARGVTTFECLTKGSDGTFHTASPLDPFYGYFFLFFGAVLDTNCDTTHRSPMYIDIACSIYCAGKSKNTKVSE